MKRLAGLLLTSGVLAGCFFVSDFSNLSGGVKDAGADVSPGDATIEASVDAGDPCEGAKFCDRFESGNTAAWTRPFTSDNAILAVERSDGVPSPPYALRVGLPARPAAGGYTYLEKVIATGTVSNASLVFQLAMDRLDPSARACIAAIVFGDNTASEHVIRLLVGTPGGLVEEKFGGETKRHDLSGSFTTGSFREVELAIVDSHIVVRVGAERVLDVAADPSWRPSEGVRIVLGINFTLGPASLASGFDLRFDDVRLGAN